MNYTMQDYKDGICLLDDVGMPIAPPSEPQNPKDLVSSYMDVFQRMGGIDALGDFAKRNPGKFYDQLLRLLISMEAPKQTMQIAISLNNMSAADMENLTTNELKLRLIESTKTP